MPDWVKAQIDMDDYVNYLKAPVGTWDGKTYRITIDGDCHTFSYRKDFFGEGAIGGAEVPKSWQQVNAVSKAVVGQTDPLTGLPAFGYLDPLKGWGGFGFYFLENRASAYAKHPADPAWLFDPDTMKPRVNNPAWVQAIQDVMDLIAHPRRLSGGSDQRRSRHHGVQPVPCRNRVDADVVGRCGVERAHV